MVGKSRPRRHPAGNVRTLFPIEHKISLTGKVRSRCITVKQIVLLAAKTPGQAVGSVFSGQTTGNRRPDNQRCDSGRELSLALKELLGPIIEIPIRNAQIWIKKSLL